MVDLPDVPGGEDAPPSEGFHPFQIPHALREDAAHDLAPFHFGVFPELAVKLGRHGERDVGHDTDYVRAHRKEFPCEGGGCGFRQALKQYGPWLSDDLAVTVAVKERGLRVRFVPRAVCLTEEPCDRRACLDWTTQQSAFVRAYYPRLTRYAALVYAVFDGAVVLGVLALLLAVFLAPEYAWGAGLLLVDIPLTAVKAEHRRAVLASALPEWREAFATDRGRFLLASLVVPWLMIVNLRRARRLTAIAWRGRSYPLPRPIENRY